jgi:hypothetical protein
VWNYNGPICGLCSSFYYRTSPNVHPPSRETSEGSGKAYWEAHGFNDDDHRVVF